MDDEDRFILVEYEDYETVASAVLFSSLLYEITHQFGREFGDIGPFTPQSSHRQGSWVSLLTQSLSR